MTLLPVAAGRACAVEAGIRELDGREIAWFRLAGGPHRGAIGTAEGDSMERLIRTGTDLGLPVVGIIATSGAEIGEGVDSLHAWGRVARALTDASGVVPIVLAVVGPCLAGPSLLLALADVVVMSADAMAYVCGPDAVERMTGHTISAQSLGGAGVHATRTGIASLVVEDEDAALAAMEEVLAHFPANNFERPPEYATADTVDRDCARAALAVPKSPTASYDVRAVVGDVVDVGSFLELSAQHAPNLVTGLATVGGRPVGVVANQPLQLAGTLDIAAAQKGARHVRCCDAFNVPLLTFVDTPGFQPGKDIEWQGMIRHGAQLVHAYAASTVPRIAVLLRKAYGGAYIVMDSKSVGSDCCLAWPTAEIAVMGAAGAVQILHGKRSLDGEQRAALEADYAARHCTPERAAARGYVDDVIRPEDTRRAVYGALRALHTKREHLPRRRHDNLPL